MALNTTLLKKQIETAYKKSMSDGKSDSADADKIISALSQSIADAVEQYIKSATIIIPAGITVSTAGTPAAQTGATTAPSAPANIS